VEIVGQLASDVAGGGRVDRHGTFSRAAKRAIASSSSNPSKTTVSIRIRRPSRQLTEGTRRTTARCSQITATGDPLESNVGSFGAACVAENQSQKVTMLELRPSCECCDADLPAGTLDARICSFECTFCARCADGHFEARCPNCGGPLVVRPPRLSASLEVHPASTIRIHAGECPDAPPA
jgi:hypothetical protein